MIKKNIKKYALICLTAILVCTMGVLVHTPLNNVKGSTISIEMENVQENNRIGTEITLENEVTVEYKGSNVPFTNGSITFPDGKTYGVGSYKLTQVGNYVVRYYYKDGNVIVTAENKFVVTDKYYDLTTVSGSITPVTAEEQKEVHESEDIANGKALPLQSNADNILLSGKDGIIVRLQDGCQFIYNTPVDLSKGGDDGIAEILSVNYRLGNLIPNDDPKYWRTFMFTSGVIPTEEEFNFNLLKDEYKFRYAGTTASRCKIRLTDAYNPDLFVELDEQYGYLSADGTALYYRNYRLALSAAANGQALHGCTPGNNASGRGVVAEINGTQYNAYKNWNRACSPGSFLTSGTAQQLNGTTWGYDYKTNIVYAKEKTSWSVVNDLDHPTIYPDNAFPGFTTGEVYVSIYFTDYSGMDSARIDILKMGEASGADLCAQYNKTGVVDNVAPEIVIDYNETDPGVVYAPLGGTVELPKAFVKEVFSDGSYSVNVYTNYNTPYKKLVSTKNNMLELKENAVYTVEYTAYDTSGHKGQATMNICPVDTNGKPSIYVDLDATKLTGFEAGALETLPEYKIKTINNENKVKLSIKVIGDNETIIVDPATRQFRPQYVGKYKVVFEYEDNAYSGTQEYEIDVVGDGKAKFLTKPILPKYLVKGETYSFPMLKGYLYTEGNTQAVNTEGFISINGGEYTKISNIDSYKVEAEEGATIAVKFGYDGEYSEPSVATVVSNTIVHNDKDVFRLYKYFVGDYTVNDPFNAYNKPTASSIVYNMNKTEGDQTLSFVNILDADRFMFQFKPGVSINYASLNIVLTDIYDENVKLVIKYFIKGSGYVISLNGVENYINNAFNADNITYTIEYNKAKKELSINDYIFSYGFEGFNSNLCYFDIVMEKVTGAASITVERVGNHVFRGTKTKDDVVPQINVETSDGTYEIGSKVILNPATFTDVISQIVKSKNAIKIEHEDGATINVENVDSPYELTLDKLGVWTITYFTEDTAGSPNQYRYALTVADKEAPEITVENYADDTMIVVKAGTIYKLNYTVSDNITAVENIRVSVRMENMVTGEYIDPASNTELKCTIEGDYMVYIVAVDDYKNCSVKIVYIRVEGGKK